MIRVGAFISWCISQGIGDVLFWSLLLIFGGYMVWLMEA